MDLYLHLPCIHAHIQTWKLMQVLHCLEAVEKVHELFYSAMYELTFTINMLYFKFSSR